MRLLMLPSMKQILVLNGPNLNRLGKREPEVYGKETLEDLKAMLEMVASGLGVGLRFLQSNHEGALIDALHQAADDGLSGVIFNPGAYSHYSIALRDAVQSISVPVIEVHISNVHAREEFRHKCVTAGAAKGVIAGLGLRGYVAALHYLAG